LVLLLHLRPRALPGGVEEGALESAPAGGGHPSLGSRRPVCVARIWQTLVNAGLTQSMSSKANCYDNAMIESFWRTLKTESTARNHFKTCAQARLAVFDFIECFYNPHRRHSSIGGVSPVAFETLNN
jgi:putative transposase